MIVLLLLAVIMFSLWVFCTGQEID